MVNYTYVNDKISAVSYSDGITTTNIATGITYGAFNPQLSSYTWGNSATYNQAFTADGVISSITAANAYPVNKTYGYDSRFNITGITETGTPARSSTATYDSMSRINNYSYGTGNSNEYTYNTSEDRTSQKLNSGISTTYNYGSTSHKLTSLSGASTDSMTYDLNGNILTASGKTYTYNAANRMATSNDGTTTTSYLINFMGQRTQKSNTSSTTWFIYDENDNVIAEYDAAGNLTNEYVYLDNRPVALLRSSNLYYIYTDHLNTPRAITDTANNLQWTWENKEAFGNNLPNEVIAGFKFNFRLPGQYFDSETNLNYNIHRDYNPVWGRYMSSDPLGLAAGINTYGYVSGNSLVFSDKLGLNTVNFGLGDGFIAEQFFKTIAYFDSDDRLRILSHGSPLTVSRFNPEDLAEQIVNGRFLTADGIKIDNYFKNRIRNNLPINIYLDACDTGAYATTIDKNSTIIEPYAKRLGIVLKKEILNSGSKSVLNIKAPNGLTTWALGIDYIYSPHYSPYLNGTNGKIINFGF